MSLAEHGWRKFPFFDKVSVKDPKNKTSNVILKLDTIRKWQSSSHKRNPFAIFGEDSGIVWKLTSGLDVDFWKPYNQRLTDLVLLDDRQCCFIVSLGIDNGSASTLLKVWDLEQWEKNAPNCRVSTKVHHNRNKTLVVNPGICVAALRSLDFIVVGFLDGSVIYSQGDFTWEKNLRWKILRDGSISQDNGTLLGLAVTNVGNGIIVVFAVFDGCVLSFTVDGSNIHTVTHDVNKTQANCWFFNEASKQLIVANEEIIYFYDANMCLEEGFETGRCHALCRGLNKRQVIAVGCYVGVVVEQERTDGKYVCMLTLYDVEGRYTAAAVPIGKAQLFTMAGKIYLLNDDGSLTLCNEKPTTQKIEILLEKNLYDVAITLAKRGDVSNLPSIYIQFADYLYSRADFQNSIQQYIKTIGVLEPSYVVKRFLEGTRAAQLAMYLEALHDKQLSNEHHTLLMLGAYLKTGNKQNLETFVARADKFRGLDVKEAVHLLRTGGHYDLAVALAIKYDRVLLIFAILVEDLNQFDEAVNRLAMVRERQLFEVLDAYGLALLEHCEDKVIVTIEKAVASEETDVNVLIKLLNGHPRYLRKLYDKAHEVVRKNLAFRNAVLEHTLERMKPEERLTDCRHVFELVDEDNYDIALRLAQLHNYHPLVIHILSTKNHHQQLLNYLMKDGDVQNVIKYCEDETLKTMWLELISYLSKRQDIEPALITQFLEKIFKTNLVHPLVVSNVLSRNKQLPFDCVRDYLEKWLVVQNDNIKSYTVQIEKNATMAANLEKEIQKYDDEVQVFQTFVCKFCDSQLSPPAVYFNCRHAYHSSCYESLDGRCPECSILDADDSEKALGETRPPITLDELTEKIENCGNPMTIIANFIARGIFDDEVVVENVSKNQQSRAMNPFEEYNKTPSNPFDEPFSSTNPFDEN